MSKITILVEGKGSKSTIVHTKDSIMVEVENEEMEKPVFELSSIDGSSIKIEETGEMYIKGGTIKIDDVVSRISKVECAITQINNKLLEGDK